MNPSEDSGLQLRIESELPEEIEVGRGNLLTVYGWCFHPRAAVRKLELVLDGEAQPLLAHGMPRPDLVQELAESGEDGSDAYRSGFWGLLELRQIEGPREAEVGLRAKLAGGETATRQIGNVRLLPGRRRSWARSVDKAPKVAVCMATFNPPPDLFRHQIESIRAQTYENWTCLISDDDSPPEALAMIEEAVEGDPRFRVERHRKRLGYYRNFERVLASVPEEAELVALSDQDDQWKPDKLEVLVGEMSEGVTLAYSDVRLTDTEGRTASPTFWTERENNHDDLAALLLVNSITGGASLFRSELLDYILPFPTPPEGGLHDHWIGMVALSLGDLAYVDRPLYDYVQHGSAAIGHESLRRLPEVKRNSLLRILRSSAALRNAVVRRLSNFRLGYPILLGVRTSAQLLLLRGGKAIGLRKRRLLRRCLRLERSPAGWAWLLFRKRTNRAKTLGSERHLLGGSLWRAMMEAVKRLRLPPPPPERETLTAILKLPLASQPLRATRLQEMIAPLRLDVSEETPQRVNIVIPTIDLGHFFGGYIAKFNLARKLAESGMRVRMVVADHPFYEAPDWRQQIESFEGLSGVMDMIEIDLAHDRSRPLQVNPADRFVATTWWTAHVAHSATQQLGAGRFLYLIQECEPLTFPMGSSAALARQTYDFPHYALFSTELLRDYFRRNGLGVFSADGRGEDDSMAFENAITPVRPPTAEEMVGSDRKLLFYARPERHAERNMFELGLFALAQAVEEGILDGWQLHGIGGQQPSEVRFGDGLRIKVLERRDQSQYADMLRGHAVGLSLMLTPHPSLVPLEMASAGMPVVTNTFENKTAATLAEISQNLIATEPTIEGVKGGIKEAVAASADHARRLRGAEVRWSDNWDQSFGPDLMERVKAFIEQA